MCQTASDVAHKMVDYNFGDIENVIPIHDDLIIAGDDFEIHHGMTKHSLMFWKGLAPNSLDSIETKFNTVSVLIR